MTDRDAMYKALTKVAWAYLFIYFDFNLGTVSATPAFVGYCMILSALPTLAAHQRDLALLRPLGILMAAARAVNWLLSWGGASLSGRILVVDLILSVTELYFHFQLFTDLAAIARAHQTGERQLDRDLLHIRTIQVLFNTALILLSTTGILRNAALPRNENLNWAVSTLLGTLQACMMFAIMSYLFALRKLFQPEESPAAPT